MSAQTLADVDAGRATDDAVHHVVCCDPNTALCGTDVTDEPWKNRDATCYLCAVAEENNLPCSAPSCPEREVTR